MDSRRLSQQRTRSMTTSSNHDNTSSSYFNQNLTRPRTRDLQTPNQLSFSTTNASTDNASQSHSRSLSRPSTTVTRSRPSTTVGRKSRATTTVTSILGHGDGQSIVCAVSEARGVTPSVGVAFVNVTLGEAALSQICDNQSYVRTIHKLQVMRPSRILFMPSACPPSRYSTLHSLVQNLMPEIPVEAIDRSVWSETAGLEYIQELAFKTDIEPLQVAITGKYYATSSFSAVSNKCWQHMPLFN